MRIGAPKETRPLERRVAVTPESTKTLRDKGYTVIIEPGAGLAAGFTDEAYVAQGAQLGDAWAADVIFKVQPPTLDEVAKANPSALLVSLIHSERNPGLVDALAKRGLSVLALEKVPRITRAQKMDVLSSQANLAGYRAVVEAAHAYTGFFGPQITAAGASPPAKVLIIGAGVAGLAALGAARGLGAEVRAFDTRSAAREQVESLGGKFLEVTIQESGEGGGGYAKVMSKEFIEAEMALFRAQAREVDVVITTALVPGTKAPTLLPKDVTECFRPGAVIVDMAAEQGGNCELTVPGQRVEHNGVVILGWTDLSSRMAPTASRFFAGNLGHLVGELGTAADFKIKLDDDVVRPALLVHKGEILPPLAPKPPSPTAAPAGAAEAGARKSVQPPPANAKPVQTQIMAPTRRAWGTTLGGMAVIVLLFLMGRFAPPDFLRHSTVFVLACFVGWQVIWSVTPALHTPLMSVTNAISGIIIIGGMLQIGADLDLASILGALAVLLAAINVAGGFLVTHRMLKMFRREGSGPAHEGGHKS